ncbi:MAG: hypothetical protein ACRD8Z_22755 [Nitrososphaeraceae archaeon]
MSETDEHQTSPESNMEMEADFADQVDDLHICKGYVQPEALPLNQLTIKRAQYAGIWVPLLNFSEGFLAGINQMQIKENTYDDLANIIDLFKELALPLLGNYRAPNVEIGSFMSPDTGLMNVIYLSRMQNGIIIVEENGHIIVSNMNSQEIWRYLYEPFKIVENIVSMLIAVAEKHKSIRDDWISSFQKIRDLSQQIE